jgi:iron complex transport system substrate-binding protein
LSQLTRGLILACLLAGGCDGGGALPAQSAGGATRIVALSPHLAELAFTAGAGERLVGAVEYSDFPAAAGALPRVGDAFRLDYEGIAALDPDLVLAWRSGTPAHVQARLSELGYRVIVLDATTLAGIAEQITAIGELAGTSSIAAPAATAYLERLREIGDQYRDAVPIDVFYQISAQPLFTISGRHAINEAIELCGGRNVFADIDGLSPAVSLESVLVAAPQVIVSGQSPPSRAAADALREQWSAWTSIPAVREGNLFVVDADLLHRPAARILEAIVEMCDALDVARGRS